MFFLKFHRVCVCICDVCVIISSFFSDVVDVVVVVAVVDFCVDIICMFCSVGWLVGWLVGRLVGCLVIIIYLLWSIRTGLKNYFVCESENKLRVWLHWIYKGSAYLSHSLYVFFFQKYSFPFACSFTFDSFIFNINACFIHALFPFRLFTVQCTKGRLHCTHKKRRMREITSNMQLLLNIDIDCPP